LHVIGDAERRAFSYSMILLCFTATT